MPLTTIFGGMKSSKSDRLIAEVVPFEIAGKKVIGIQHEDDIRNEGIVSRTGKKMLADKYRYLWKIPTNFDVIAIDEVHMFDERSNEQIEAVCEWLALGKHVFIAGLDTDYARRIPPIVRFVQQLKPENEIKCWAVCDSCSSFKAGFSQILRNGEPVKSGLPSKVPEDGTYDYEARCRNCHQYDPDVAFASN